MVSYFLNWTGPINRKWLAKNGYDWSGGRVDVYDGTPYGTEHGVAIMNSEDWKAFAKFLTNYESKEVLPLDELVLMFEIAYGREVRWFNNTDGE